MLNVPGANRFFENCLVECGLLDGKLQRVTLSQFVSDEKARSSLSRTLRDIKAGADKILNQGKPNDLENAPNLTFEEWEWRWNAWAASRKAAFYSRAALFLLGEEIPTHFSYFTNLLRTSHNIVFVSAANDVLQHATKRYLTGSEEDLGKTQLANWWEQKLSRL